MYSFFYVLPISSKSRIYLCLRKVITELMWHILIHSHLLFSYLVIGLNVKFKILQIRRVVY